jgi:KUP system potassium uptake protein
VLSLALWSLITVVTIAMCLPDARRQSGRGRVLALAAARAAGDGVRSRRRGKLLLGRSGRFALLWRRDHHARAVGTVGVERAAHHSAAATIFDENIIRLCTIVILVVLFCIQSRGTAQVSKLFGPICILWFLVIGGLGVWHIADEPSIARVVWPGYGVASWRAMGCVGLFVLGAVFLTVTGAGDADRRYGPFRAAAHPHRLVLAGPAGAGAQLSGARRSRCPL